MFIKSVDKSTAFGKIMASGEKAGILFFTPKKAFLLEEK